MELHVLGPAFGLPSIDAECIAAVALLRTWQAEGWKVIPTADQTIRLPYLRKGDECIDGFKNIVRYVERIYPKQTNVPSDKQRADSVAISSFIESHAQTLLDISLYVSFENYSTTRTAFTKILPWHANYLIPPQRRKAARNRTEHLGISSIDMDDVHEDLSNRPAGFDVGKEKTFESDTQKRASLLLPQKNTLRSLLQRPEHSAVFKLHALAENFFEPLQAMLGRNEYFLGASEPHAVDCLVYGHLSLMLYPQLPQDWLAKTMRKKYADLVQYTERMHERLGLRTNVDGVMALAKCESQEEVEQVRKANKMLLPWCFPSAASILDIFAAVTRDVTCRIPLVGSSTELIHASGAKPSLVQKYLPAIIVGTSTTLGLLGYYAFATGLTVWPRGEELHVFGRKRLTDYGHLGAALAGVGMLGQQATQKSASFETQRSGNPLRSGVEVGQDVVP